MTGRFLLDTNIVIGLFANDFAIQQHLKNTQEIFIPSIVIGELYYGARNSNKIHDNLKKIDKFSVVNNIISCDADTAKYYGLIKQNLRQKGNPIPENDIWIAAIAQQYDFILVSRDKHFGKIDDLQLEAW
ncbi:MAG: type II toxin-antitoxin system VapC family toxin [Candidatus Marithrix sp.]